jgi:hypothetical protein
MISLATDQSTPRKTAGRIHPRLTAGLVVALGTGLFAGACQKAAPHLEPQPRVTMPLAALWNPPEPNRDLFAGVAGPRSAPATHSRYVALAPQGRTGGPVEVADPQQRRWIVSFDPGARATVTASRLLWGIGYHQLPTYAVSGWRADRTGRRNPQPVARFTPRRVVLGGQPIRESGLWTYAQNPFTRSRELAGLVVLQVMFGNTELPAEHPVFEFDGAIEGARVWYVPRGFGRSFGAGTTASGRGDVDAFEKTPFIAGVRGDRVLFDPRVIRAAPLDRISPADVRWACSRLASLSDRQWRDAFRAGGYTQATANRLIKRMKAKVAEGLALRG